MNILNLYKKYFLKVNLLILLLFIVIFAYIFYKTPLKEEKVLGLKSGNTDFLSYNDLKNRFEKITNDSNPEEAISILEKESLENEEMLTLCHDILHVIGHTAYHKYGNLKEALVYQNDFCNSGYVHGLFEEYFSLEKDPLKDIAKQCDFISADIREFDIWQCHHGIGHGFMYFTGGSLDESLNLCQNILKNEKDILSCQNGVYMEVFNLQILAKEINFVDKNNPFNVCKDSDIAKNDCYFYTPTYFSQTLKQDFVDIFDECKKLDFRFEDVCINGVGSEAMKRNMNEPNLVFELCVEAGSFSKQSSCVSGVVSMYINQKGSLIEGAQLCEIIPKKYQDVFLETVQDREYLFM